PKQWEVDEIAPKPDGGQGERRRRNHIDECESEKPRERSDEPPWPDESAQRNLWKDSGVDSEQQKVLEHVDDDVVVDPTANRAVKRREKKHCVEPARGKP